MPVTENLLRYTRAKNYQSRPWFDKVTAKIPWVSFFDSHDTNIHYLQTTSIKFIIINTKHKNTTSKPRRHTVKIYTNITAFTH